MSGLHLAEFVEKASPIATKAAIGTGAATTGASAIWTLPDIAALVGIVCTIAATSAAITFQYLNYRLNRRKHSHV